MNEHSIDIAKDFSRFPAGRYQGDGPYPGEVLRQGHLVPALRQYDTVTLRIDGVKGYGSSFLEEAFGGLVRVEGFDAGTLRRKLIIGFADPVFEIYKNEIWQYIDSAKPKR